MKPLTISRRIEISCDVGLILAVLFTGLKSAMILHAMGTPLPKGQHAFDAYDEENLLTFLLNYALPIAALALVISAGIKIRARTLQPLTIILNFAALIGVFACAVGVYGLFVASSRPLNLWTRIWWMFSS